MSAIVSTLAHTATSPHPAPTAAEPSLDATATMSRPRRRRAYRFPVAAHVAASSAVIGADLAVVLLAASGL